MKTQQIIIRIITVAMCICMMACCSKSVEPEPEPTKPTLSFSPSGPITFTAEGGQQRIIVTTNQDEWRASSSHEWCHIDNDGFDLVIFANENSSSSDMPSATVSVEVGEAGNILTKTITVNQKGKKEEPDPETTHITKEGGTVKFNDLRIIVPEGGYQKDVDVTVKNVESDMGEFAASSYYKVILPRNFTKPFKIQLPINTENTQGDVFFRISVPGVEISSQKESSSAVWIKGEKEENYYTAILDPFDEQSEDNGELIVGLVKDYEQINMSDDTRAITSEKKCAVFAPRFYHDESMDIEIHAEESMKRLEAIGFSFAKRNKQIQIEVKNLSEESAYGYFVPSRYSSEWNYLVINSKKLSEKDEIKRTIIHEMTHFVQYYYDPRWVSTKSFFGGEFLWMDEAVAVWAESLYVGGVSSVQFGNQFCPIDGFFPMEGEAVNTHGYGMAGLIRWIANSYGKNSVVELHKKQEDGAKTVYEAFLKAFPDLFLLKYHHFLSDYIREGGVKDLLLEVASPKLIINSMDVVKREHPMVCQPYSAYIERIQIKSDYKLPSDKLFLSIDVEGGVNDGTGQYCELFRYNSEKKEIQFVDKFYDSYQFEDVEAIQKKKEMLYAVYYHPYNEKKDVTISVKLAEKLEFSGVKLKLSIDKLNDYSGFFTATFPDEQVVPKDATSGTTRCSDGKVLYNSSSKYTKIEGSNKFVSEWKITIEIDEKTLNILRGSATNTTGRYNRSGALSSSKTTSFSFKNIPFIQVYSSDGSYHFGASESDGGINTFITDFKCEWGERTEEGWITHSASSWDPNTDWSVGLALYTN